MKYQVTVNGSNNIQIGIPIVRRKRIDVTDAGGGSGSRTLSELEDVNLLDRQNNYLLIWNASTARYDHVPASEILDRVDGTDDGVIDYGTF